MVADAHLTFHRTKKYINFHETENVPIAGVWRIKNSHNTRPALSRMRETASRIQSLIGHAIQKKMRLRPIGSKWSFSEIPSVKNGWILQTDRLNYKFNVTPTNLSNDFLGNGHELILAQSGCLVSEINMALETGSRQQALRTSGASNGQTLGGAISANTHGSALGVGAMPSQVAGFQLLTATQNLWIESPRNPTMNAKFAKKLGAELVRDEQLFQTALIGLGAVGIVHSYMMRSTGRYLLDSYRRQMRMSEVRKALNTLDFTGVHFPITDQNPYFFQAVINPGVGRDDVYVTTRFKVNCPNNYPVDYKLKSGHGLHNDLPGIIGKLVGGNQTIGPSLVNALLKSQQKAKEFKGTPGETYDLTSGKNGVMGSGFCVPIALTTEVVDIVRTVVNEKFAPLIIALRYVQRTDGYLSFTRFDPSCVLDIDGLDTPASRDAIKRILRRFDQAGIPYTQHWGKIHGLTKSRLQAGYGDKILRWKSGRERLLPDSEERFVFSNDLLDDLGLTGE